MIGSALGVSRARRSLTRRRSPALPPKRQDILREDKPWYIFAAFQKIFQTWAGDYWTYAQARSDRGQSVSLGEPTRGAAPLLEPIALPPTVGVLGALREKAPPEDSGLDAALETGSVVTILSAILKERRQSKKKSATRTRSTIQIRPNVRWPTLDDNNQDVERFYHEFEGICQLANDSSGMSYAEMFLTIGNCLKGARKNTYEVVRDQGRLSGEYPMQADVLYHRLKEQLLEFRESRLERQARVSSESAGPPWWEPGVWDE